MTEAADPAAALLVAFQGEPGAFSEMAARAVFGEGVHLCGYPSFRSVFEAVEEGEAARGVLPVENTVAGSIRQNYDLLLDHEVRIVGETRLRIVHNLIASPGVRVEDLRRLYAHPQAAAQCERFVRQHADWVLYQVYDTAGSVKMIRDQDIADGAAIASAGAARTFGMEILVPEIEDDPRNTTRFVIIAPRAVAVSEGADKASLVYGTRDSPGALLATLQAFADHGVNLVKLESRPSPGKPWEYLFHVDLEGRLSPALLEALRPHTTALRVLGEYPRG